VRFLLLSFRLLSSTTSSAGLRRVGGPLSPAMGLTSSLNCHCALRSLPRDELNDVDVDLSFFLQRFTLLQASSSSLTLWRNGSLRINATCGLAGFVSQRKTREGLMIRIPSCSKILNSTMLQHVTTMNGTESTNVERRGRRWEKDAGKDGDFIRLSPPGYLCVQGARRFDVSCRT
jgi:hypothetical protein